MIKTILDFWRDYEGLYKSLILADKKTVADSLKNARMYVNGMTDGWFDFLAAFEKTIKDNQTLLSIDEKNIADDLLLKLKKSLNDL